MAIDIDFSVTVRDGETVIELEGTQSAVVVVESDAGERIYLPPDGFRRDLETHTRDSPYQSAREDSPYQSVDQDSPYQSSRDDSSYQSTGGRGGRRQKGMSKTPNGFRIIHPEPTNQVELLHDDDPDADPDE